MTKDGNPSVSAHEIAEFDTQPVDIKHKLTQDQWRTMAWVLARRAAKLARSMTKKDAGRVQQAVTAAGIAYDKLYKGAGDAERGPAQVLGT